MAMKKKIKLVTCMLIFKEINFEQRTNWNFFLNFKYHG